MFNHVVFFKLKNQADLPRVKEALLSLHGKVPELKYAEVGVDVLRSPRSFDISFISRFDSRKDFETYSSHPLHNPVADFIHSVMSEAASVDYEG